MSVLDSGPGARHRSLSHAPHQEVVHGLRVVPTRDLLGFPG